VDDAFTGSIVSSRDPLTVWTIGHSSRTFAEFLGLLESQQVERIADVRRHAGSRAHPHFNPGPLASALASSAIQYCPFPDLGGRRKPNPHSSNTVWRNASFRGYADYMETPEFRAALHRLIETAKERPTALLCSEAVWWRCHRALIADALKVDGVKVLHIMDGPKVVEHPFTAPARVVDGKLQYGPPGA
jgi:uncharacterized protein (DUF488 family)